VTDINIVTAPPITFRITRPGTTGLTFTVRPAAFGIPAQLTAWFLTEAWSAPTITRDETTGAAVSAEIVWPDGTPGEYLALTLSTTFPGAVDAYSATYGTLTLTQPAITRDATGAPTIRPTPTIA
jgi:hypothetical protein